jgi:hypothetical protein
VTARLLQLAGTTAGQLNRRRRIPQRTIAIVSRLRIGFWGFVLLLTYEWIGFVFARFPSPVRGANNSTRFSSTPSPEY